jgi:nucleoside-diphosphate-sugar epimerase
MTCLLVFGSGYVGTRMGNHVRERGWRVLQTSRAAAGMTDFNAGDEVRRAIAVATHILSCVPPGDDEDDPVLHAYGEAIAGSPARWIGYLSSTGVYGDTGGAWVDESAPIGGGRRSARSAADARWAALRPEMRVFRLPGIYGPGRSPLDRVRAGKANRIDQPGQVFSRIHVDDIVSGIAASFDGPPGIYNLADDLPCAQNLIVEAACDMLAMPWPPLEMLERSALSPQARAFHGENRRVANGKARRLLGWQPRYPTYAEGLAAIYAAERDRMATIMPASASAAPEAASTDQRYPSKTVDSSIAITGTSTLE